MSILEKIKLSLRLKSNLFDEEIVDIINACIEDLKRAGCTINLNFNEIEESSILVRACVLYAKANFGNRNDSEKCDKAYQQLKKTLALTGEIKKC